MNSKLINIILNVKSNSKAALNSLDRGVKGATDQFGKLSKAAKNSINSKNLNAAASSVKKFGSAAKGAAESALQSAKNSAVLENSINKVKNAVSLSDKEFDGLKAAYEEYNKALSESVDETDAFRRATAAAQRAAGGTAGEAKELAKQAKQISTTNKQAAQDVLKLSNGLTQLGSGDVKKALKGIVNFAKVFRGGMAGAIVSTFSLRTAIGTVITVMGVMGTAAVRLSQEFREAEQRTGAAAEALGDLRFELEQTAVTANITDLQEAILNISERFGEAAKDAGAIRDSLQAIGFSQTEIVTLSFSSPEEQVKRLREELANISSESERLFRIREIAAEDGARILPLLENSLAAQEALRQRGDQIQVGDRDNNVDQLNKLQFATVEFQSVLRDITESIGAAFSPTLVEIFTTASTITAAFANAVGPALGELFEFVGLLAKAASLLAQLGGLFASATNGALQNASRESGIERILNIIGSAYDQAKELFEREELISSAQITIATEVNNRGLKEAGEQIKVQLAREILNLDREISKLDEVGDDIRAGELRAALLEIGEISNAGDALDSIRQFSENGLSPENSEKARDAIGKLDGIAKSTLESTSKIAPSLAAVGDVAKLNKARDELAALETSTEEVLTKLNELANDPLVLISDPEGQATRIKIIERVAKESQEAIQRKSREVSLIETEVDLNQRFGIDRLLATFDESAQRRIELEEEVANNRRLFAGKLTEEELDQYESLRKAYAAVFDLPQQEIARISQRNEALNISSLLNIDASSLDLSNSLNAIDETFRNQIQESAEAAYDRVITEEQFEATKARAENIRDFIASNTKRIIAENRDLLKDDALEFSELISLDTSSFNDINSAFISISQSVRSEREKLTTARANDVITTRELTQAVSELAAQEQRLRERAQEAVEFNNGQSIASALDLSNLESFDTSGITNVTKGLNDLGVAARQEIVEINKALDAGLISKEAADQSKQRIDEVVNFYRQRIEDTAEFNLQIRISEDTDISNLLNFDSNISRTGAAEFERELVILQNSIKERLENLVVTENLQGEDRQRVENIIGQLTGVVEEKLSAGGITSEFNFRNLLLAGVDDISNISANDLGLGDASNTLLRLGEAFRENVLDVFSFVPNRDSLSIKYPALNIDLSNVNSTRDGIIQINEAIAEEVANVSTRVREELGDRGLTEAEINTEIEKRKREILDFGRDLREVELPIQVTLSVVSDFAENAATVFSAINDIQQSEIDDLTASIGKRAKEISDTQSRLREAIEIGDVNEVRSAQSRLNGLVAVQKQEDALAKKKFEANKKTQKALATVNILAGAAQAISLGFPQGLFAMATVLAAGAKTLAAIDRTEYQSSAGLDGLGSIGGNDIGNNTDLNSLSSNLTAEELVERGLDDDDDNRKGKTSRLIVSLPDGELITTTVAKQLLNQIEELKEDNNNATTVFV